jgi:hypothetical protein
MSRITTLSIAYQSDLSAARKAYEEFVREVESRPIRVPVNGFGNPNGGISATAANAPTGAYTFSGSYQGTPATTIAGTNLGGGAQQQATIAANAVAGPMGAATPQMLVDRMIARREREASVMTGIETELQARAKRGEIDALEMMGLGSRQSIGRAVREGMREPRAAGMTISREAAMADARAYAEIQELRRDGFAGGEPEEEEGLESASSGAASRGPRLGRGRSGGLRFRSGLGRMLTAMYAARELAVLSDAASMQYNPLLNQTALQSLQTSNSAVDRASGILLGIPRGIMNLADSASLALGADPRNAGTAGFGIFGHYSPLARATAEYNLTTATNIGRAQTQGMIGGDQAATAATLSNFASSNIVTQRNPYEKRRAEADEAFMAIDRGVNDQRSAIQLQLAQAQAEDDKGQANILITQLNAFEKTVPGTLAAARRRRQAERDAVGFEEGASVDQMRFSNQATKLGMSGFEGMSNMAAVNAKFAPVFDANGQVIAFGTITRNDPRWEPTREAYRMAGQAVGLHEEAMSIMSAATSESLERLINRDPLGARIATIRGERDAQLKEITDPDSPRAQRIRKESGLREDYERKLEADRDALTSMSLGAQGEQISTLLGKAPGTQNLPFATRSQMAQVMGIRQAAEIRAEQFTQEGKGGFAVMEMANAIGLIDVQRQNLFEGIRGEQFDVRHRDLTNPRDQDDIGAILKEMKDDQKHLAADIAREISTLIV